MNRPAAYARLVNVNENIEGTMKKKLLIIGTILAVIAGAAFVMTRNGNGKKEDYKTVAVSRGEIIEKALAIGEITPRDEIQVKSKIAGIVKNIYAEVGDKILVGQPLVEITPDPTPLEITEARRNAEISRVAFEQAENEYLRQKQLLEANLISRQEFEQQKMAYEEAQLRKNLNDERLALIEKGRTQLGGNKVESVIRAPISGTVLEKFVNAGDPVVPLTTFQAGTPIFTLADMSRLIFRGTIDEIDVGKVKLGMQVDLKIGALPNVSVKGQVSRISPKAKKEENSTLFDIEIDIVNADSVQLRAGYSANADIIIRKAENVLYIPERLVSFEKDSTFVEVTDTVAKTVSRQPIQIGLSDGVNVEVTEGLAENNLVVERPPKEIK